MHSLMLLDIQLEQDICSFVVFVNIEVENNGKNKEI